MIEMRSSGNRQKVEAILAMLPDSARSLIKLQECSPLPFTLVTRDGYFIACNDGFCQLLGYGGRELLSKFWADITPPEWQIRLIENWMLLTVGQFPRFETEFLRKDGSRVWAEVFPNQITDASGNPLCYYAFVADITERKTFEQALRLSEERYRLLAETAEDFIYIIDRDFRVVLLNRAGAASIGMDPEKARGMELSDIFPEDTHRHFRRNLLKIFESGQPISDQHHFGFPGRKLWLHVKLTPVRDDAGNVTHVIGISRDITDLKQAEETLRGSERKLSQAQRTAHIGNWEWDISTGYITCSEEVLRIFGIPRYTAQFRFPEVMLYIHPEDKKALRRMIKSGEAIAGPGSRDLRIKRPDGEIRHVQLISDQIVRGINDEPLKISGTLQDITERKQIEIALRLDEARLQALLELNDMADAPVKDMIDFALEKSISLTQSKVGYIGTISADDKYLIIESFSQQAMEQCGIKVKRIVFPVDGTGLWPESILRKEPVIINDYDAPHPLKKGIPEGHVKMKRLIGIPVLDNGRVIAQCMLGGKEAPYDESDVRQLNLLLGGLWRQIQRRNTEKALQESKLKADLYVDLMGHDINNLNQIALGYIELARDALGLEDEEKEFLDKPLDVLGRSSRLIRNVRKLQRVGSGEMKTELTDLGYVLEEVCGQYRETPGKEVTISSRLLSGAAVRANALLRDVFANLIDNAVNHSKGHDLQINLDMAKAFLDGGWYFRVDVEDGGPGIPDDLKKKIFDRHQGYFAVAKSGGLGLHLARTLVESYGGKIWAEDRVPGEPSMGSRFVVLLPLARDDSGFLQTAGS